MRFDPSQPADQVFGVPGVVWAQHGRCYDLQGREVTWHRELLTEDGDSAPREIIIVERVVVTEPVPELPPRPDTRPDNSGELHWTALRAKLAMFDEPYTSKEAALAFLAGRGVTP